MSILVDHRNRGALVSTQGAVTVAAAFINGRHALSRTKEEEEIMSWLADAAPLMAVGGVSMITALTIGGWLLRHNPDQRSDK